MSKDKISDYSATANSNTDIGGINIDEGCAPSGINDAIRTLMKQIKDWQSGSQDVYIHPAGSASAPSVTATGDTNTGLFFPAADTIAFAEGGTESMRLDSSGNLGLGVTPSTWQSTRRAMQIGYSGTLWANTGSEAMAMGSNGYLNSGGSWTYLTTGYATLYSQGSGQHQWFNAASGTAGNAISFTQAMTLDASGNLWVGTTGELFGRSYGKVLGLSSATTSAVEINSATGSAAYLDMGVNGVRISELYTSSTEFNIASITSIPMTFSTNNTERARIDSSGNVMFGKTSYGAGNVGFQIANTASNDGAIFSSLSATTNSSATNHVYSTGASAYRFYVGMGGTVYATSTTITGISDQRLKENIRDLDEGLNTVMALRPRKFDWKEGKGADIKNARGFIAQEFEEVLPDMIEEWKDPAPEGEEPYKAVNANLIPTLVKAIQEQQAIITALTARIEALEA